MTPAIEQLEALGVPHRVHAYEHDASAPSYGAEAADKLGVDPSRVFKTLIVQLDDKALAVAIVPVSATLSLKRAAKALGSKKAKMADPTAVSRTTGYVLGGVSPLGQRRALPTVVDGSASDFETVCVSGGRRGLEIELAPSDLIRLTEAKLAAIAA